MKFDDSTAFLNDFNGAGGCLSEPKSVENQLRRSFGDQNFTLKSKKSAQEDPKASQERPRARKDRSKSRKSTLCILGRVVSGLYLGCIWLQMVVVRRPWEAGGEGGER